ncbi:MAG TPA: PAS domain S-box protein [Anaerolineae bacterium]|nr:PAS domain S-box protein [Anaerolineae bacterium]
MLNSVDLGQVSTWILEELNISYILVDKNFQVLTGNLISQNWPIDQYDPAAEQSVIKIFPELLGFESKLLRLGHSPADCLKIEKIRRRSNNGQDNYFNLVIKPYQDEQATFLLIVTEITDQSGLRQELQAEREKNKLLHAAKSKVETELQAAYLKLRSLTKKQTAQLNHTKTKLKYREQQLQILNAIPDLIIRVNRDGVILDIKPSEDIDLFSEPKEFIGKSLVEVLPTKIAQQAMQAIRLTFVAENTQRFEYQLTSQQQLYDYEARTSVIEKDEVLLIVRDITQRKRVEQERFQYIERLQILREIDKAILEAHSSEAIAQATLTQIRQLIPVCSRALVTVFHFDTNEAQIFAVSSTEKTELGLGQRMDIVEYGNIARLKKGSSFVTRNLSTVKDKLGIQRKLLNESIQSTVQAPLIAQGQLIGELILGADYPNAFSYEYVEIASEVADRMAIAIQNTHLYNELDQRIEELATLNVIGQTIASTLNLPEILTNITDHVSRLLNVTAASVVLLDKAKGDMWFATAAGEGADFIKGKRLARNQGIVGWVVENGEPALVSDTTNDSRFFAAFDEKSGKITRSVLCVPLQAKGRTIGAIEAINKEAGTFNERDLHILSAVAASAATAIENARLYQQAQQEIIERKQAERELDLFFTLSLDMLCIMDLDGYVRRSSPAFEKTLGWASDKLESRPFFDIIHPQDLENTLAERARLAQGIPTDYFEVRCQHKNGTYRWLAWSIQPGADGILYGVARDVTKQKQTEDLLRSAVQKNSQLAAAIENAPIGVSISDPNQPNHPIVFVNPAFSAITGYSEKEVIGKNSQILHGKNTSPEVVNEIQKAISKNRTYSCVLLNYRKDGTPFWNELTLSPVFDNEGNLSNFVELVVDVTARKQAQESLVEERALLAHRVEERTAELRAANVELAHAARLKDEFLANMSHELRTPLNAILSMSEILKMETYGPINDEQKNTLKYIEEGGRHLLALINEILDLSKIEAGQLELDLRSINIDDVCQASLLFIKQMALKKQIKVISTFDSTINMIEADERRLKQILVNLLSNAAKFTPIKGTIGLEVEKDTVNGLIHFIVWDTGIGISKADQKRLFDPFVQIDSSLAREYEGTGLGLALVQRLTEMHKGRVTVDSEIGKGSRFTVSLPVGETSKKEDPSLLKQLIKDEQLSSFNWPKTQDVPPDTSQTLILVVDDNEASRIALTDLLKHKKYQVTVAKSGTEAITKAKGKHPNIILMDVQMPEMDGLEAIRQIRGTTDTKDIPVIALTALAMPGDREKCLAAGANDYLSKPINMKKLLGLIETQLSGTILP